MKEATRMQCQSCGMPIESGPYCQYCADEAGRLHPFEEQLERMVQFFLSRNPSLGRAQAEKETLAHMRTMPAWRDHPRLQNE